MDRCCGRSGHRIAQTNRCRIGRSLQFVIRQKNSTPVIIPRCADEMHMFFRGIKPVGPPSGIGCNTHGALPCFWLGNQMVVRPITRSLSEVIFGVIRKHLYNLKLTIIGPRHSTHKRLPIGQSYKFMVLFFGLLDPPQQHKLAGGQLLPRVFAWSRGQLLQ